MSFGENITIGAEDGISEVVDCRRVHGGPIGPVELWPAGGPRTGWGSPATLGLDTGAVRTCFDRVSAQRLGLCTRGTDDRAAGLGVGDQVGSYVAIPDFSIGPCRLPAAEAMVVDLGHVNHARQRRGDRPFDGVLGSDLLVARAAVLDYGGLTLYLREGEQAGSGFQLTANQAEPRAATDRPRE